MAEKKRKIAMTAALPYANGDIHIGHLVEYVQADIWARYQRHMGNECVFVCADDTHGTPVMIRARKEGITPEELVARSHKAHLDDFTAFQIKFDNYYTTNSPENKELAEKFFAAMEKSGAITARTAAQLYCDKCKMFLPDRFVKGTCPSCGSAGQYGDSCDKCGAAYAATELGSPVCTTCGGTPVTKDSKHLYFELEPQHEWLREWIGSHVAPDVSNKLMEWFGEPLRGWCISRDAPYFGFEIPGHPGKYFYVWLDAPIGYIASITNLGRLDLWNDPEAELYHFIGKDITRFHVLFWPAMLRAAGFKTPDEIFVHGFLTVDGEKMSKSKGTFINARTYLEHLPADALRYYYAAKTGGTVDDMDLNLADFVQRVNSDLVGKIANIASRGAQMLHKKLGGRLGRLDDAGRELLAACREAGAAIAGRYEKRRFNLAIAEICRIADAANAWFDKREPWKTVKTDEEATRTTLTAALNAFRIIAIYLKPVLPAFAERAAVLFGEKDWLWSSAEETLEERELGPYEYLARRIETAQVEAMVEAARVKPAETGEVAHESRASKNKAAQAAAADAPPLKPQIAFGDFERIDLRTGRIESCEAVPKSSKLLKFTIDAGALGKRAIFSGIRGTYADPSQLVGKEVVFVANLAPRRMSVGVSEGMILYAGEPGTNGGVVSPLAEAGAGTPVT